ncbi:SDR family oxidoreductase [Amycolatopsis thermophila]|uniref:Nucleoside-diphosphate-sugar epimerase n=1 Tax=Amycolatopsis thermophila TaxID=206084 RepID=A0ABU0F2I0_9PSEU|nr:SDR family oxidoreductase [Amycolatopsis thermophila]MDQ0381280.1 nucleoside-diphosphate-sugar epimerase [Amycolatopsis thermophila]
MTASTPSALVVGATGIAGSAVARRLTGLGWPVDGLSRREPAPVPGVRPVLADVTDQASATAAITPLAPTHVFLTAWSRQRTEAENIEVNARIVRNVVAAAADGGRLRHVALMTGLKHYLGPFEAYGRGTLPDTPFHEDEPRLDTPNFYYAQEDELFAAAARHGFTWSVHRAHTVIGHAIGNAMNMATTLAVQAVLCRETGRPFRFPGSEAQWHGLTDMTDADLLADQMIWAATTDAGRDQAFNVANGDVFRWRWMWPRIAGLLGVEPAGYDTAPRPLEQQMAGMEPVWAELAARHGLRERDLGRLASWWHTDGDLNRPVECLTDLSKSRKAGFTGYVCTLDAFSRHFDLLRELRIIPA